MTREQKKFWKNYRMTQEDRVTFSSWDLEQIRNAKEGKYFDESAWMERIRDWGKRGVL